jgi:glycine/D-amino acid oxidase-like deaminating enzyme
MVATETFPYRTSFWGEKPTTLLPALNADREADVVVIGGGFAGLSAARYLKAANASLNVALLEANYVGFGASGRNAGGVSLLPPLTWLMHEGERLRQTRWAIDFIRRQIHEWAAWVRQEQIDCDLQATPLWITAGNRFQTGIIRWLADRCQQLGYRFDWLTAPELHRRLGVPAQGSVILDGYTVQPFRLARGLLDVLLRQGVAVYEGTRVASIAAREREVELVTTTGARVAAQKVVLATNAYSADLKLGYPLPRAFPLHTYMLATAPLADALRERLLYDGKLVADASLSFYYGRVYRNRMLFGGTDRLSRVTPEDDRHLPSFHKLYRELHRRFPALADVPLDAAWGGAFQQQNSETPIVRALAANPNIILNIGYGGSGVALTQFSGKLVQGLALGEQYIDADAEQLRQTYKSSTLPVMGLARTSVRILRNMLWR